MPVNMRCKRGDQFIIGIGLGGYHIYLSLVLSTYHYSLNGARVLTSCATAKKLNVVSFHPQAEEASFHLWCKLFLFYPYYTSEYYPITRSTLINQVTHDSDFYIVRQLTGWQI